jgi:hypothetical protein
MNIIFHDLGRHFKIHRSVVASVVNSQCCIQLTEIYRLTTALREAQKRHKSVEAHRSSIEA